jgi:sec-independent protein translocase protein TatA
MLYLGLPGIAELWPILVVLLLLFGAKKLPELARAMGSSINMFKKGLSEEAKAEQLEEKAGRRAPDSDPVEERAAAVREREGSASK